MSTKRTPPQHWFSNPTETAAIRNSERQERQAVIKATPKIYICSPYKGDTEKNTSNAIHYCRFAVEQGKFPIAPHCYLPQFMNDNNPAERELALSFGIRLLHGCRELWIFTESPCDRNHISEGMKQEIKEAKRLGIPIRRFNTKCEEVLPNESH